jgi:trehalose 6-phosphate phosphatase
MNMKIINPKINIDTFFSTLHDSPHRALLLDYDGTLAPFKKERDKAFPYPGIREILERVIQGGHTKVVIISGRRLHELVPLIGLAQLPEIWGSHGGERLMADGTYSVKRLPDRAAQLLSSFTERMEQMGLGDRLENKPLGLAVHWRGLDQTEIEEIRKGVLIQIPLDLEKEGLSIHTFDGGLELRPVGINKGEVVREILKDIGQDFMAAYMGDDLTDEDAFEAIKGRGIGILVKDELYDTKADVWLRPPEELFDFLDCWASIGV